MEEKVTWKDIEKVNAEIKTTKLPQKKKNQNGQYDLVYNDYVEVKERVIAFRKLYPVGGIITEVRIEDKYVHCIASIYTEEINGILLAKGHARELLTKDFAVENAETSAIGRALGFCGLGIDASIASAEEMAEVNSPSGIFDEPVNPSMGLKDLADEFRRLYTVEEQARVLNNHKVTKAEDIGIVNLEKYVNFKKYGKK